MRSELEERAELDRLRRAGAGIPEARQAEQTIRRQAAALEAEGAFLSTVLENLSDAVVACDAAGNLTVFNRAAERLHGLPAEPLPPEELAARYGLRTVDGLPLPTDRIPLLRALRGESVADEPLVIAPVGVPPRTVLCTGQALRDSSGQLLGAVVSMQDITARKHAEDRAEHQGTLLEERNRALEAANRLKLDLIGMLGHEIGNPLAVILGYTELASDSWAGFDDEDKRHTVAVIDRNARALSRILREVLALVSLDAGRLTASPEPVDLAAALPALVAAAPRTGRCRLDVPAGLVALVQPGHLDQMMSNLLSNAAKYAGGATGVTVTSEGTGSIQLRIRDDGRGIPQEFHSRLFERFARAEGTAGVKGTGLGLYITRELARANGGDLHHEPGPDGCGAVFVVTLPAPAREAGPGAASGPAQSR